SQRDGNQEIYVMDADGKNPSNLTQNEVFDADPAWSPDGKQIAFASSRKGVIHLFVMGPDGSGQQELLDMDLFGWVYPAWSPDGKRIAAGGRTEIGTTQVLLVDLDGGPVKPITRGPTLSSYATWSPDGRYLAYVHFLVPIRGLDPGREMDLGERGGSLWV